MLQIIQIATEPRKMLRKEHIQGSEGLPYVLCLWSALAASCTAAAGLILIALVQINSPRNKGVPSTCRGGPSYLQACIPYLLLICIVYAIQFILLGCFSNFSPPEWYIWEPSDGEISSITVQMEYMLYWFTQGVAGEGVVLHFMLTEFFASGRGVATGSIAAQRRKQKLQAAFCWAVLIAQAIPSAIITTSGFGAPVESYCDFASDLLPLCFHCLSLTVYVLHRLCVISNTLRQYKAPNLAIVLLLCYGVIWRSASLAQSVYFLPYCTDNPESCLSDPTAAAIIIRSVPLAPCLLVGVVWDAWWRRQIRRLRSERQSARAASPRQYAQLPMPHILKRRTADTTSLLGGEATIQIYAESSLVDVRPASVTSHATELGIEYCSATCADVGPSGYVVVKKYANVMTPEFEQEFTFHTASQARLLPHVIHCYGLVDISASSASFILPQWTRRLPEWLHEQRNTDSASLYARARMAGDAIAAIQALHTAGWHHCRLRLSSFVMLRRYAKPLFMHPRSVYPPSIIIAGNPPTDLSWRI
jgi:hypothetical protein